MVDIDVTYEEIVADLRSAKSDGRITEMEYNRMVIALIRGKFRGDEDTRPDLDPIIVKVLGEEFNSAPIEDTKESNHEEDQV